jgi:hypothetical protein
MDLFEQLNGYKSKSENLEKQLNAYKSKSESLEKQLAKCNE